jgi:voltage-gated potassium channel
MSIAGNLLVQEAHDPGIAQVIEAMASNRRGTTLFSVDVGETGVSYTQLGKSLFDHSVNVMAVNRGTDCLTVLTGVDSKAGDRIVYAAARRTEWAALRSLAGV